MLADDPSTPLAPEMAELPRPVLGFIGAIKEWVDLDLLQQVAERRPDWTLVMVGPIGAGVDVSALSRLANVILLGRRDRQVLPFYLKGFDVCLNPFRLNRLTETVSPLKFYEYLASGKPIASVPMPEIQEFAAVVEFGTGLEGFMDAIERALDDTPARKAERLRMAWENSWESRVAFMMDKIAAHLEG
jgi:glycosyltransferase involved in cell wall biosynthesis